MKPTKTFVCTLSTNGYNAHCVYLMENGKQSYYIAEPIITGKDGVTRIADTLDELKAQLAIDAMANNRFWQKVR